MRPLARLIALLLLAVWLPGTLCCAIEASGLLHGNPLSCAGESNLPGDDDHCAADNCEVLKANLMRPAGDFLLASAPDGLVALYDLLPAGAEADRAVLAALSRPQCPPDLLPRWRFVERAALQPRAP